MAKQKPAADSDSGTKTLTAGEWRDALVADGKTFADATATYRTWDDLHNLTPTDERTKTTDG